MDKPEVVLTTPFYAPKMAELEKTFTVHRQWEAQDRASWLAGLADRVRAIAVGGHSGVNAALMDALPKLKMISAFGVGVDAIDLAAARQRGVAVTNTPDVLNDCVADLGIGLLLAVARRISEADRFVRAGKWLKGPLDYGTAVGGKTIGIVGMGRIGQAIARRAAPFGMEIAYHSRTPKPDLPYRYYADLAELAAASHFLVVITPGGAGTRHLINERILQALGKKGFLINIARGSVVDEAALVAALQSGVIAGAGLDVVADEPRAPEALFAMDNVVLQPHQASATHDTRAAMGQLLIDNLKAFFAGAKLLTPVI